MYIAIVTIDYLRKQKFYNKIPISSLILLNHNHKNSLDSKYVKQIRKLDNYIYPILYYVRSENGREKSKSTGMGLYIAKKLCVKLGHRIEIESEAGSFTRVVITFGKNDFFKIAI